MPTLPDPPADREAVFRERVATACARGWALDDQWVEPGLPAIAAPVRDPAGRPVAAVNVLTHTSRHTADTFPDTVLPRLHVLCDAGYATTDGKRFALLPKVLDLGYARLAPLTSADIAQPHLAELAAAVGESASMAVLDGDQVRYVARVAAGRVMRVDITIGTRFPAYATSMGRVLLADLPAAERAEAIRAADRRPLTSHTLIDQAAVEAAVDTVARDGWAMVDEELHEGLRSLAIGVRDTSGVVVAAVDVALHVGRATPEETARRLLPALRATAARIEADLAVAYDQAPLVVH